MSKNDRLDESIAKNDTMERFTEISVNDMLGLKNISMTTTRTTAECLHPCHFFYIFKIDNWDLHLRWY